MTPFWKAHHALNRLAQWGPVRGALARRYEQRFASNQRSNLFRGVFNSFEAAQATAPATRPVGYDNEASAALYVERSQRVYPTDYPVMLWLQTLLAQGCDGVFDLGGHIGVSFYAYKRYLRYPPTLRWCVHDVPAVMAQGQRVAAQRSDAAGLTFADHFGQASGMPVLLAAGSLQYLQDTLAERLAPLAAPPAHLLVNLLPLHETRGFHTLQSMGTAFCPYRVEHRPTFEADLAACGYELVDHWHNPEKRCEIPFQPAESLDHYHGYYFRRR